MAMFLIRIAWAKFSGIRKNGPFVPENILVSDFLIQIQNQPLKMTVVPNFSQIRQSNKGVRILTWNDTGNCLMTSYIPHRDDVRKKNERFCPRVPWCQVWW